MLVLVSRVLKYVLGMIGNGSLLTGFLSGPASCSFCRCGHITVPILEEAFTCSWNLELYSSVKAYLMCVPFCQDCSVLLTPFIDSFYKNIVLYVTQFWVRLRPRFPVLF